MRTPFKLFALGLLLASTLPAQVATMPPPLHSHSPDTRGYTFIAPVDFTMTGVRVLKPPDFTVPFQNFAVVRFDGAVNAPPWPATTNAFQQLALGFDLPQAVFQPVNVQVQAGDLIGVYGNTMGAVGNSQGTTSYAAPPPFTMIGGHVVPITRSIVTFHLGSATSPLGIHDISSDDTYTSVSRVEFMYTLAAAPLGMKHCSPANTNTSGFSASLVAAGSTSVGANDVVLTVSGLPLNVSGFLLTSPTQGFTALPGGSQGNLCLAGAIGRYYPPTGQILNSGSTRIFMLSLDLLQTPTPNAIVAIQAGETWNFQAWFRDMAPAGGSSSNFSDGLQILFQQ